MLKSKAWNIGLTALGLVLIIFSLIWLLVIFPSMNKLPADYHEVVNFQGTYQVMISPTQPLQEIPVNVTREQTAKEVEDNVLIMNQTITNTNAITGTALTQFDQVEELWVNRTTREYVPGGTLNGVEVERSGQFAFPEKVEQKSYLVWIPTAGHPLTAKFIGEDEFHGLKVFTFNITESDLDFGTQQGTGLPQVLDVATSFKVEPVSGTTVRSESNVTISVVPMPGVKMPVYVSHLVFTDDTINDLVDTASSARTTLLWAQVYGFWLGIGLGIVLTLVGVVGLIRTRPKKVASS